MANGFGISPDDARMTPVTLVGSLGEMEELLERRRERWQMSYMVIPQESMQAFAPLVAKLAGS